MTPAINLLKKLHIKFSIYQYQHDPAETHFGKEAIEYLTLQADIVAEQVFKTLVVNLNDNTKKLAVCVVPVNAQLDLKKTANILNCKKVTLAPHELAQKITGYLVGGISPLAQKKSLPTFIDNQALAFSSIFISAGRRGVEIELSPHDLANILPAQFYDISVL